jgi:hypothetical protein
MQGQSGSTRQNTSPRLVVHPTTDGRQHVKKTFGRMQPHCKCTLVGKQLNKYPTESTSARDIFVSRVGTVCLGTPSVTSVAHSQASRFDPMWQCDQAKHISCG